MSPQVPLVTSGEERHESQDGYHQQMLEVRDRLRRRMEELRLQNREKTMNGLQLQNHEKQDFKEKILQLQEERKVFIEERKTLKEERKVFKEERKVVREERKVLLEQRRFLKDEMKLQNECMENEKIKLAEEWENFWEEKKKFNEDIAKERKMLEEEKVKLDEKRKELEKDIKNLEQEKKQFDDNKKLPYHDRPEDVDWLKISQYWARESHKYTNLAMMHNAVPMNKETSISVQTVNTPIKAEFSEKLPVVPKVTPSFRAICEEELKKRSIAKTDEEIRKEEISESSWPELSSSEKAAATQIINNGTTIKRVTVKTPPKPESVEEKSVLSNTPPKSQENLKEKETAKNDQQICRRSIQCLIELLQTYKPTLEWIFKIKPQCPVFVGSGGKPLLISLLDRKAQRDPQIKQRFTELLISFLEDDVIDIPTLKKEVMRELGFDIELTEAFNIFLPPGHLIYYNELYKATQQADDFVDRLFAKPKEMSTQKEACDYIKN